MNILNTRDLIDERIELQQTVLDAYNEEFETDFSDFEDINVALLGDDLGEVDYTEEETDKLDNFKDVWSTELEQIEEINDLEDEINCYAGDNFDDGVSLIDADDFEDFVEQDLEDLGYIPKDFPTWIEIDWKATANNVQQDYTEVTFRGTTYLYR